MSNHRSHKKQKAIAAAERKNFIILGVIIAAILIGVWSLG